MNARELSTRLVALLRTEHAALGDFLLALAEFDRRKAWRELGHASLFAYLRRELGLSAGAAQYRKTAAELIQRFPEVEAALRDGRLCLSTVVEVAKVLTVENRTEVLPRFFGLSRREAEALAVAIRPVEDPPRRDVVTPVVPARAARALSPPLPDLLGRNPADAGRYAPSIWGHRPRRAMAERFAVPGPREACRMRRFGRPKRQRRRRPSRARSPRLRLPPPVKR